MEDSIAHTPYQGSCCKLQRAYGCYYISEISNDLTEWRNWDTLKESLLAKAASNSSLVMAVVDDEQPQKSMVKKT